MISKDIITVDYCDKPVGKGTKWVIHNLPVLHRAFSVFVYYKDKMLIQKRNKSKYHSGGLWTNACCSHITEGCEEIECVSKRLYEELGVKAKPRYINKFVYYHKFSDSMYEFEFDHVYLLEYNGEIDFNREEIEEIKWIGFSDLAEDVLRHPEKYTVWFVTALQIVLAELK